MDITKKIPHFFNFCLKPINKNIPLIDYNKLKGYGIWKKNQFIFKGGFGNDKLIPKNTKNKFSKLFKMERMFYNKSIINNFNRDFFKKIKDTSPPKDLFDPPIYYNYCNPVKRLHPINIKRKIKNKGKKNKIIGNNNEDDFFKENDKMNLLLKKNIFYNLNHSYSFFKEKNHLKSNTVSHIFDNSIKIIKKEPNNSFRFRLKIIKCKSMENLKQNEN